mgnify:CR=1 FL=1
MIALDAASGARCQSFGQNGEISLRYGLGEVAPGFQYVTSPASIVGDAAIVGGFGFCFGDAYQFKVGGLYSERTVYLGYANQLKAIGRPNSFRMGGLSCATRVRV